VDTVSNDISPLLQGHSVIHATEWIPKSWVSRRAVELSTTKSRGTLGFLAKLRKIGQPFFDPRLVAVTAAHIFFRWRLAHNWSMVEFFEASCQIGDDPTSTWTLDRNLTGLQFPSMAFCFGNKLNTDRSTLTLNSDSSQAYDIAFLDSPSGTTLPGSGSWMHTPVKFNLHEEHAKGPNQRNWLLTEGVLEGVESTGSLEVIMGAPFPLPALHPRASVRCPCKLNI